MAVSKDSVSERLKGLESSASELQRLLELQRKKEEPPQPLYALSGDHEVSLSSPDNAEEQKKRDKELVAALNDQLSALDSRSEEHKKRDEEEVERIRRDAVFDEVEEIELDPRKVAQKYQPLETAIATHIQSLGLLKSDIELMIKNEGKRAFWSGIFVNAFFFVVGLGLSAALSTSQVLAFLGIAGR